MYYFILLLKMLVPYFYSKILLHVVNILNMPVVCI